MFENRISNPILRGAVDWLVSIGIAVVLFFVVRGFIFRTAHVDGNSMNPTLAHGDMVILNRFAYVIGNPKVGDIVAFPYSENPSEYYIKRIVAQAGDIVDLRDGMFLVNGEPLEDDFSYELVISIGDVFFPIEVEDGRFFVLGDNRNGSRDSRFSGVGTICGDKMIGRASVRIWPPNRIGAVDG